MATNQKNQTDNNKRADQSSTSRSNSGNNSGNFANMDDAKQREVASKGGKASHSGGNSRNNH